MTPESHSALSRSIIAARNEAILLIAGLRALPASREVSIAITNAEQSKLWIKEALEIHTANNPISTNQA